MVDEEVLKIKIEAEDDASSVLAKVQENLKKFNNEADKIAYLEKLIRSFSGQCRNANEKTKALAKSLNATLKKAVDNKNFDFGFNNISKGEQEVQKQIKARGKLIKKVTDENGKSLLEVRQRFTKAGREILQYWKANKKGELEFEKEVKNFPKAKKPTTPILEEITGGDLKRDLVKATAKTTSIIDNNKKLTNSYKNVIEVAGKLYGTLVSSYEQEYKAPVIKPEEPTVKSKGKVLSYDSKNHTLQTEQILRNNKRIVRSYKDVVKEGKKFSGVLQSEKTLTKLKAGESNTGLERIKRIFQSIIAFRLASASINLFLNTFRQGIEAIKQSGGELSKPFVEMQKATMGLKISLGTIIIPLVQTLTNLLDPLSQKFIDVANAISYNNAVAKGQTEYYQLSKEKIDEYTESLNKANKQLTQLDKFATLSGKKSFALGEMVNIDPNTEEGLNNIAQAKIDYAPYEGFVSSLEKIANGIEKVTNFITNMSTAWNKAIGFMVEGLLSVVSPFGAVLVLAKSLLTVMSDSSEGAKNLAQVLATLSGAMLAVAIAKIFLQKPTLKSLGIAAAIGAGAGLLISSALRIGNAAKSDKAMSSSGVSGSSYSSAMSSSQTLSTTSNEGTSVTTQVKEIIMDAKKVGEMVVDTVIYNAKKRNLI